MGRIAMQVGFLIVASALMVATASAMGTTEKDTDRPGGNYKKAYVTFDGLSCQIDCRNERKNCKAWAWVRKGDRGLCYLKDRVPDPVPQKNVFSGVMEP